MKPWDLPTLLGLPLRKSDEHRRLLLDRISHDSFQFTAEHKAGVSQKNYFCSHKRVTGVLCCHNYARRKPLGVRQSIDLSADSTLMQIVECRQSVAPMPRRSGPVEGQRPSWNHENPAIQKSGDTSFDPFSSNKSCANPYTAEFFS